MKMITVNETRSVKGILKNARYPVLLGAIAFLLSGCLSGFFGPKRQADLMHVDCLTPPDPGSCEGSLTGYYYDYQTDRCLSFTHGDCGGQVPFDSLNACAQACGVQLQP